LVLSVHRMNHKNQHWVPRCYLEAWCDPESPEGQEPYVWRWEKDGNARKRKAPNKIFVEKDLYTLKRPDGTRDLRLEHGLSGLESDFATVRNKLESGQPLTPLERATIIAFIAAMHARTRVLLRHFSAQFGRLLALGEQMKEAYGKATPEQRKAMQATLSTSGKGTSLEEVREIVQQPQKLLHEDIRTEFTIMSNMSLAVLEASEGSRFITSDAPVTWIDPTAHTRPPAYQFFGLGSKTIEVTMPLSPRLLLFVSWYHDLDDHRYVASPKAVEEANRITRFHCHEYFVTNNDSKNDYWFQSIEGRLD
jgi:Protein of unknown function (DUF4238)